ncbi:hypothetical protein EDD11_010373, partial [Mortierella claussenii]
GSALVRKLVLNYPEYFILVVDKLDYCSSLNNLYPFLSTESLVYPSLLDQHMTAAVAAASGSTPMTFPNFRFLHADITDLETVQGAMMEYKINTVIHLAAQTHVDKSFGESIDFTKNNVLGTHVMLEATRK